MRVIAALLLMAVAVSSAAGGYERERVERQKQKAIAMADGSAAVTINGDDAAAIAPNPSAPPPSAQCRFGWGVTGAGVGFGAGITASEWDEICGLWLAAQQTTGEAKREAAAAAFCLTMKKAKVQSPTCKDWEQGQGVLAVEMNDNKAAVVFGGVGTAVAVRDPADGP